MTKKKGEGLPNGFSRSNRHWCIGQRERDGSWFFAPGLMYYSRSGAWQKLAACRTADNLKRGRRTGFYRAFRVFIVEAPR